MTVEGWLIIIAMILGATFQGNILAIFDFPERSKRNPCADIVQHVPSRSFAVIKAQPTQKMVWSKLLHKP